jgi:hypothetical protein
MSTISEIFSNFQKFQKFQKMKMTMISFIIIFGEEGQKFKDGTGRQTL